MSFKKKIYFSFIGYIISFFQNSIRFVHRPFMVYGYYNQVNKKFLRNVRISSSAYITGKKKLDISDGVWVNHYARIDASGGVKIGKCCQIGYGASILSHSSHNAIRLNGDKYMELDISERIGYIHKAVSIGDYTFVGGRATILPGVKIGKGCVIGVAAVVTKDVPDFAIVAGVPATIIKSVLDIDQSFFENAFVKQHYFAPEIMNISNKR